MDIEYLLHLFILKRYVADPWYEVDSCQENRWARAASESLGGLEKSDNIRNCEII